MTHLSLSGHILLRGDHISQVRWVADWCAGVIKVLAAQKGVTAEREVCHEYLSSTVPLFSATGGEGLAYCGVHVAVNRTVQKHYLYWFHFLLSIK